MLILRFEGLVIASKDIQKGYWTFSNGGMDNVCAVLSQARLAVGFFCIEKR